MESTTADMFLLAEGYYKTQPGYYETDKGSNLFAICDDNKTVTFYDGTTDTNTSLIPTKVVNI